MLEVNVTRKSYFQNNSFQKQNLLFSFSVPPTHTFNQQSCPRFGAIFSEDFLNLDRGNGWSFAVETKNSQTVRLSQGYVMWILLF